MTRLTATALAVMTTLLAIAAAGTPTANAAAPSVDSSYGSGVFGRWGVDGDGLPRYRYTLDHNSSPAAAQPELNGKREAFHQLGNDHIVANAYNRGHVQLWSQDRLYQWANYWDPNSGHYSGGYGYLNVDGEVFSTLWDDRRRGTDPTRDFGTGYFEKRTPAGGIDVTEQVYAPFGDDPLLLHDVTLKNTTDQTKQASWFEYWDVNPYSPGRKSYSGVAAPTHDAGTDTLIADQLPNTQDPTPLSLFAAPIAGPVDGFETDSLKFFGTGGRAKPAAVTADALTGSLALPTAGTGGTSKTLFAFRAPVTLKPGQSVTLRYAYGMAKRDAVAPLIAKYKRNDNPFGASQREWKRWMPQTSFGSGRTNTWLSRELQWDSYLLRSGTTYEQCAGRHVISQGGYYQYDLGFQGAYRDPLQHMLPLIYSAPNIARDVIAYSAAQQPQGGGQIPYARISRCTRFDLGTSNDLDLWLLLSAAEYGLASRDLKFFDTQVGWLDSQSTASLWDHLKAGFRWQETQRGPHGGYIAGGTGDWSDFSTEFLQMTESILVTAQAAYIYPRLAELADLRGDRDFAAQLRATAAELQQVLDREWTGKGWYSRAYTAVKQVGSGAIFGEPQPWALLAGAADSRQARTLVANIRRFLTGHGAPGGPAKIGSSQSPAIDDPEVTETTGGADFAGRNNNAVWVGGSWYAVNGWLTWALGELDGIVPRARDYAWDELKRNTLAAHATVYPDHWNGIISVDDMCQSWYSDHPADCGVGLSTSYNTQIMHQPAWTLFATIKLAGVDPLADGYRIDPHLPMSTFTLKLPNVSVVAKRGRLSGHVRTVANSTLRMRVAAPRGRGRFTVRANGRKVRFRREAGLIVFDLKPRAGRRATWTVVRAR